MTERNNSTENKLPKDWNWVKLKKMWQLFGDKTDENIGGIQRGIGSLNRE